MICAECRKYRRQLLKLREIARSAVERLEGGDQLPGIHLADEVRNRLRRAVDSAEK